MLFTRMLAGGILNAAEVALSSHANAVVLVRQVQADVRVEIEAANAAVDARVELQAAGVGPSEARALDLAHANPPHPRKRGAAGNHCENDWIALSEPGVDVH